MRRSSAVVNGVIPMMHSLTFNFYSRYLLPPYHLPQLLLLDFKLAFALNSLLLSSLDPERDSHV